MNNAPRTILELEEMLSAFSPSQPDYDICSECGEHAELDEMISALSSIQSDYDICSECGEHAEFDATGSECCGAQAYDTDPDIDTER